MSYYQSLIGILHWIVELGHVDICLEVSMMSGHLALQRGGHLQCLYHMLAYLKKYHNAGMVYDLLEPHIYSSVFAKQNWIYSTMSEEERKDEILTGLPEPKRKGFIICCFVDAGHAGDSVARKSCSLLSMPTMRLSIGIPRNRGALSRS